MKLKNIGLNNLIHLEGRKTILLKVNEIKEVAENIAKIWAKLPYVEVIEEKVVEAVKSKTTKKK